MKITVDEHSPVQNAARICIGLANAIDVRRDGLGIEGSTMNRETLATIEQAEAALPFAERALLDAAIEDAVVLLTDAPLKGEARAQGLAVAGELLAHLSQSWHATQTRKRAELAARNAPTPPSKVVELVRDREGRVTGANVFGS